jgi:dTDP-glucose pyrophosphorylase
MNQYLTHIINEDLPAREALRVISDLPVNSSLTLFVIDSIKSLKGTLTDGDIRRGLLNGLEISQPISKFMFKDFRFIAKGYDDVDQLKFFKNLGINFIPVLDNKRKLVQIIDLKKRKASLPITAFLMAGGRGERLKPLTDRLPKPMLIVGDKPIIEHNIDRLIDFGITEFYISVRYLKNEVIDYFGNGDKKGINIKYVEETEPLGTIGSISLVDNIENDDLLVMNSDILTNIDYEDFYFTYKNLKSDMTLVSIPYVVAVPYAVLKTQDNLVYNFEEKPNYTYYSNGGIYLMNTKTKNRVPRGQYFNATDLMELLLRENTNSLTHYPLLNYWLDIGRHSDFLKAQEDIKHLNLY